MSHTLRSKSEPIKCQTFTPVGDGDMLIKDEEEFKSNLTHIHSAALSTANEFSCGVSTHGLTKENFKVRLHSLAETTMTI